MLYVSVSAEAMDRSSGGHAVTHEASADALRQRIGAEAVDNRR